MGRQISNIERLNTLGVGETDKWPIEKLTTIRSAIYTYGRIWRKTFSSRTDENYIYITRQK